MWKSLRVEIKTYAIHTKRVLQKKKDFLSISVKILRFLPNQKLKEAKVILVLRHQSLEVVDETTANSQGRHHHIYRTDIQFQCFPFGDMTFISRFNLFHGK